MDAARAAGRPILGVVLYLGNWEAMGMACLAIGYPVAAVYVPDENRFAERFRARMQKRYGAILIPAGPGAMRAAVRTLNQKTGQFGIFIDEFSAADSLRRHLGGRCALRATSHLRRGWPG